MPVPTKESTCQLAGLISIATGLSPWFFNYKGVPKENSMDIHIFRAHKQQSLIKGDFRKFKVYRMCKETCNNQNRPASLSMNRQRLNFGPAVSLRQETLRRQTKSLRRQTGNRLPTIRGPGTGYQQLETGS